MNSTRNSPETEGNTLLQMPDFLGLTTYPRSQHVLCPEKMSYLGEVFGKIGAVYADKFGRFIPQRTNPSSITDVLSRFEPTMNAYNIAHGALERKKLHNAVMHITPEMIVSPQDFIGFLFTMFVLLKDSFVHQRELVLSPSKDWADKKHIRYDQLYDAMTQDADLVFFLCGKFSYHCPDVEKKDGHTLIRNFVFTHDMYQVTRYTLPALDVLLSEQKSFDRHMAYLCKDDETALAGCYQLADIAMDDASERLVFCTENVFIGEGKTIHNGLVATPAKMHAFRTLLASSGLACYEQIISKLCSRGFHYLWKQLLRENRSLCRNLKKTQDNPQKRFFTGLFGKKDLAKVLKEVDPDTSTIVSSILTFSQPAAFSVQKKAENWSPKADFFPKTDEHAQITRIILGSQGLPPGTQIQLSRQLPGEKMAQLSIMYDENGDAIIEPAIGRKYDGFSIYQLEILLPNGFRFANNGKTRDVFIRKIWIKAAWTEEEKGLEAYEQEIRGTLIDATQKKVDQTLNASGASQTPSDNNSQLGKQKVTDPVEEKNPKESEKEDLQAALGMFLENISRNDLLDLCEVYACCKDDSVVLEFPETLLAEYYFVREHLSGDEVKAQLRWTLTITKGKVSSSPELPRKINSIALELAKRILEKKEIQCIDAEFRELGFSVSETRDNAPLRIAIKNLLTHHDASLTAAMHSMSDTMKKHGMRFFEGKRAKDGLESITLSRQGGWKATLHLLPKMEIRVDNPPDANRTLHRERVENALLTFVFEVLSRAASKKETLEQTIARTQATESQTKLRKKYRAQLRESKARLLIQLEDGKFTIIEGISRETLAENITKAQAEYGVDNVAILYRAQTYHFHGNGEFYQPTPERLALTYEEFLDPEVGEDRRNILRDRILRTLFNGASGLKNRSPFIPGSEVDLVLLSMISGKTVQKYKKDGESEEVTSNLNNVLTKEHIDDAFVKRFIAGLKSGLPDGTMTSRSVPVTFHDALAGYCDKIDELTAAQ